MKNYYQILGVKRDASQDEIKKAYRALAKKYHPDANENKEEVEKIFQEITMAYKVLSDPGARKQYNTWGHETYTRYAYQTGRSTDSGHAHFHEDGHCGACGGGHSHEDGHCGACGEHAHEDGHCGACDEHNPRYHRPKEEEPAPRSIRSSVYLSYQEMLTGAVKETEITERIPCTHCGQGGQGDLEDKSQKCPYCYGKGYIDRKRKVKVNIPPRCYSGCFFPLQDVLCEGEEVKQDNIVVLVFLSEQDGYERRDYHLYSTKKVNYTDMVLGGEIELSTIEGSIRYILKPATRNGARIRLQGKGLWMPPTLGNRGDQYVTLQVEIPSDLTVRQKEALQAFREAMKSTV